MGSSCGTAAVRQSSDDNSSGLKPIYFWRVMVRLKSNPDTNRGRCGRFEKNFGRFKLCRGSLPTTNELPRTENASPGRIQAASLRKHGQRIERPIPAQTDRAHRAIGDGKKC